jgi:Domain of unknown function (DUF4402)
MIGENRVKNGMRFACALAMATWTVGVSAHPDSETVDAQVAIVTRGEFIKVEDMHFGVVIPGALPGVITLAPDGTRTATGGVTLVGNLHHEAEFAGRRPGNGNNPVQLSVSNATINLTGPGAPMLVSLFRGNTNPGQVITILPRNFQVQGQANGAFELHIGATLAVGANQTPGTYTGSWSLTLDFQ